MLFLEWIFPTQLEHLLSFFFSFCHFDRTPTTSMNFYFKNENFSETVTLLQCSHRKNCRFRFVLHNSHLAYRNEGGFWICNGNMLTGMFCTYHFSFNEFFPVSLSRLQVEQVEKYNEQYQASVNNVVQPKITVHKQHPFSNLSYVITKIKKKKTIQITNVRWTRSYHRHKYTITIMHWAAFYRFSTISRTQNNNVVPLFQLFKLMNNVSERKMLNFIWIFEKFNFFLFFCWRSDRYFSFDTFTSERKI